MDDVDRFVTLLGDAERERDEWTDRAENTMCRAERAEARIAALRRVVAAADAMRRYDSYRMPGEPHWQYDVARAAIKEQTP
jgi:hypothetical protein